MRYFCKWLLTRSLFCNRLILPRPHLLLSHPPSSSFDCGHFCCFLLFAAFVLLLVLLLRKVVVVVEVAPSPPIIQPLCFWFRFCLPLCTCTVQYTAGCCCRTVGRQDTLLLLTIATDTATAIRAIGHTKARPIRRCRIPCSLATSSSIIAAAGRCRG